jgi:hypothetical protein
MSKSIHVPKWVCNIAIVLSSVALVVQAGIDIDQGTVGMVMFSRQWFAQAWQMGLVTMFVIVMSAFAGRFFGAGRWIGAVGLYLIVIALMVVTVINGADFIADTSVAERIAQSAQQTQERDIADIKNKIMMGERKEATDNAWRTYYAAKASAEREKILGQIQAMTKEAPTLVVPEVRPVQAGSGAIWNRWLGWRTEVIQELKAIAIPVLIMLCKSVALTLGFAYRPVPGRLPEPAPRAKESGFFRSEVSRKFSASEARSDLAQLAETGALDSMDVTAVHLAKRWSIGRSTVSEWLRRWGKEGIIVLERGRGRVGNRLIIRAAPQPSNKAITYG